MAELLKPAFSFRKHKSIPINTWKIRVKDTQLFSSNEHGTLEGMESRWMICAGHCGRCSANRAGRIRDQRQRWNIPGRRSVAFLRLPELFWKGYWLMRKNMNWYCCRVCATGTSAYSWNQGNHPAGKDLILEITIWMDSIDKVLAKISKNWKRIWRKIWWRMKNVRMWKFDKRKRLMKVHFRNRIRLWIRVVQVEFGAFWTPLTIMYQPHLLVLYSYRILLKIFSRFYSSPHYPPGNNCIPSSICSYPR